MVIVFSARAKSSWRSTERLTHPNTGIEHQRKQQAVPQMLAAIHDRLNLLNSKDFGKAGGLPSCLEFDRPPPLATPFGHVMQNGR